ncbi:MAG: hypothetical protein HKL81_04940 [Acidimicrobiaceae bacterium]|nr:hypothetical protein [Acidimicrobiaceae bacterium]
MTEDDSLRRLWGETEASLEKIPLGIHPATVVEFSSHVGLGVLDVEGRHYPFHCVSITDGSREVDVGSLVCVRLVASIGGSYQANEVMKI